MLRERSLSFIGGMFDAAASADDFPEDTCSLILNGRVDYDGSAACRLGTQHLRASAIAAASGGYLLTPFRPASGSAQLFAVLDQQAWYSTNSALTWTSVASGLTANFWSTSSFTLSGVNYLLLANGSTTMYSWTGSAWAAVTGPVSGIKYVATFNERVYATKGDGKLYASKILDYATWASPDGIALTINTHDGEPITNIAAAGAVLLVQKRSSTGYVDGFGNSDVIVAAGQRGLSQSVGCIAPRTFKAVGDQGYAWLSERGIEFWAGIGSPIIPIAAGLRAFLTTGDRSILLNTPELFWALYYPVRNEYWLGFTTTGAATVNAGVVVNMTTGAVARRDWGSLNYQSVCVADIDQADAPDQILVPVGLSSGGRVLHLDYGTQDEVTPTGLGGSGTGTAIDFRVRSRSFDFGEPTRRKWARIIRVAGIETVDQTPTVRLIADGTAGTAHNLTFATAVDSKPRIEPPVRVSGRGINHQVEVRGAGGLKVSSLELQASLLQGTF